MKKKVFGRKLSRSRPAREALFSQLIRGMILNGKMVTTRAKAKAIQGDLEHMVTLAKKGDLNARKKVSSFLDNATDAVDVLFSHVAKAFESRTSGFTRFTNLPRRRGDNAKVVRVEWTEKIEAGNKKLEASKLETSKKEKTKNKKVESKPKTKKSSA